MNLKINIEEELPFKVFLSFDHLFSFLNKHSTISDAKNSMYQKYALDTLKSLAHNQQLLKGFTDIKDISQNQQEIDTLLDPLFNESLFLNEIKAATIPFTFKPFKLSNAFNGLIYNAGKKFKLKIKKGQEDNTYIAACSLILKKVYNYPVQLNNPFFFSIPDNLLNEINHFRVVVNDSFTEIIPRENAPYVSNEDFEKLLENYDDLALWKEKIPPNSYELRGFRMINLYDVTSDFIMSQLKDNLLKGDENIAYKVRNNLREYFNIDDLEIGFSFFCIKHYNKLSNRIKGTTSVLFKSFEDDDIRESFPKDIFETVFIKNEIEVVSNINTKIGSQDTKKFYKRIKKENIKSFIVLPVNCFSCDEVAILEITSKRPHELNDNNKAKLEDIVPVFQSALRRAVEEHQNKLSALIQEHYTAIHPTIKWRFFKAAENYYKNLSLDTEVEPNLDKIVFQKVHPFFGQCDIRGSSLARSKTIKQDLSSQFKIVKNILECLIEEEALFAYKEMLFRTLEFQKQLKKQLKNGEDSKITAFLKTEVQPLFKNIDTKNSSIQNLIVDYNSKINTTTGIIYDKRKEYDQAVTTINSTLLLHIEEKQEEAQAIFPHLFEPFSTDGLEFNMYIGESLLLDIPFKSIYVSNLKMWQLRTMIELVQEVSKLKLTYPLQVASLIYVADSTISIEFRMSEKKFDVHGVQNTRYEIIKKRIDKALIKGTKERITQPSKIAIIYADDKVVSEYNKYFNYFKSENLIGEIEMLELEDLQGVYGLKALRISVESVNLIIPPKLGQ